MERPGVASDCDRGEGAGVRQATKQERSTPETSSREDPAVAPTACSRACLASTWARRAITAVSSAASYTCDRATRDGGAP
jgi:hypothetical protein